MAASLPGGGAGEPAQRPPKPPEGLGAALSDADVAGIKAALEGFLEKALLPALQARVRGLHFQVLAGRKGMRSRFQSLLGLRKSQTLSPEVGARPTAAGGRYDASSPELQLRALADAAIMIQDYETATAALQFAATDFRAERAWKHLAGTQEMLGVASFLAGGRLPDVAGYFREAFQRYTPATGSPPGAPGARLATRSMLMLAAYSLETGAFAEANSALMRAHFGEDNLRAALLLEQAAFCLLGLSPPHARKFAFHMVLSGLRYNVCGQIPLATRAYKQVLSVYEGRHWCFIEEHLHKVLGDTAREGGNLAAAVEHYGAMLPAGGSVPAPWQADRLRTFLDTVHQAALHQNAPVVGDLRLPEVDAANVRVHFDDARCAGNPAARSAPEGAWKRLEASFAPPGADGSSWLDAAAVRSAGGPTTMGACVAGERISVDVELYNPLQIELSLSQLCVICELRPADRPLRSAIDASDASSSNVGSGKESGAGQGVLPVDALEHNMKLRGGERCWVRLEARPLAAGVLTLTGIEWALNGAALGRRLFTPRPPRRKGAPKAGEGRAAVLALAVMPAMPRLEADLGGLPPTLLAGEMVCCTLRLRNAGGGALHGLRLAVGGPALHAGPTAADLGADPLALMTGTDIAASPPSAEDDGVVRAQPVAVEQFRAGQQLYAFTAGGRLDAGATLEWPLWVHPRVAGELDLHYVLYYEPASPVEGMKYRCLRMAHSVSVLPALGCSPTLRASAADLHRSLLRLQLRNLQSSSQVTVQQMVVTTPGWGASLLPAASDGAAVSQPAEERGASSPASPSVQLQAEVPAGTCNAVVLYLHPPGTPGGAAPAAPRSAPTAAPLPVAGPVAWFHTRSAAAAAAATSNSGGGSSGGGNSGGGGYSSYGGGGSKAAAATAAAAAASEQSTSAVVAWSASGPLDSRPHRGFLHLHGLQLKERAAVRAVVRGARTLRHDFGSGRPCTVALQLAIRNCLPTPVSLSMEARPLQPPPAASSGAAAAPEPVSAAWQVGASALSAAGASAAGGGVQSDLAAAPDVVWCGATRTTVASLPGGAQAEMPLLLAVLAPGTYQVADYIVSWTFPELAGLHDTHPGPPLVITVEDSSAPPPAAAATEPPPSLMDLL